MTGMTGLQEKRILIFTSEFPPQPGGIGNHAWSLACELCRRGASVRVITEGRVGGGDDEQNFDAQAPFEIYRAPFSIVGVRQLRRILLYLRQLHRWSPEFVVASGRFPLLMSALISNGSNRVAVLHGTEAGVPGSFVRKATLAAVRKFSTVIAVSHFTRSYFELDQTDPRVSVIPNGVAADRFPETGNDQSLFGGSPLLTTVGNVTRRKGQDNVIRALPALVKRYPEIVYHVAGIPTEKEAFIELARKLNVADHIVFHGAVSEAKLRDLLAATDVFLMLSATTESGDVEGFGIAILEANSLGVPAVGSRGCGIEDAIDHGATGLLVDPGDDASV
ncbi:MAG: phosphatidylinositol alpha-1,6-mannosyltransferase, partial [Verrucomicrobiales bacterium]